MTHIQQRGDDAAVWTSVNPVLFEREVGWETDTLRYKIGDGVTAWTALPYVVGVESVAGKTGDVTLVVGDVTGAAPLASPTFTGDPKAPTPSAADNDTSIATTAFVKTAMASLVDAAPSTLDTLNELAAALGDDPNFAATTATALGEKAPLASPAFTGNPTAPTPAVADNDTSIATTAHVKAAIAATIHPAFFASVATVAIPNETFTGITGLVKQSEKGTAIPYSGSTYTVPTAGWYVANLSVFFATGTGIRSVQIRKNGVSVAQNNNPAAGEETSHAHWEGVLAAGDTIQFMAYQNTGASLNALSVRASLRSEGPAV